MTTSGMTESAVIPAWRAIVYLAAVVALSSCVSAALAQTPEEQVAAKPTPEVNAPPGDGEPAPYSPPDEALGLQIIQPTQETGPPVPWTRQLVASWLAMPVWLQELLGIPIIASLLAGLIIFGSRPLAWTVGVLTRARHRKPK
ncbi:MAG: hypothetical protein ACC700_16615 [Anaerolineales bacterium]